MAEHESGQASRTDQPEAWRRHADWALIAGFAALVTATVLPLAISLARGPDHILIPYPKLARGYFGEAGASLHLFKLLRLWTGCLTGLNLVAAAVLVFRQRRNRRRQPVAVILAFAFLLLSAGMNGLLLLGEMRLLGLAYLVFALGLMGFTLALMIFPDSHFVPSWMRWIALAQVVLSALGIANLIPERPSEVVSLSFLLLAVGALLWRYRGLSLGTERQQIRWALLGFAAGAILIGLFFADDVLLQRTDMDPVVWVAIEHWQMLLVVPLMNLLITGGLVISLLKYRLYDADRVITRSVSFGALTLTLLAVFAGTERIIELLGEEYLGHSIGAFSGGIAAALAVVLLVPLHRRLDHWAEHKFQKELIRLRTGLPLLVGDMREAASVARIAAATLDSIRHGVRASRAALLFEGALLDARGIKAEEVDRWRRDWRPASHGNFETARSNQPFSMRVPVATDDQEPAGPHLASHAGFDIDRSDPLFPLRVPLAADGHGRIGWLLLGPRPDGSFYGNDERETLAQIADPVARALKIAAAREKREGDERAAWEEQRTLNRALLGTLQAIDGKLERLFVSPAAAAE